MVNKKEKEKQLLEDLDKILDGQEIPEPKDEDTRSALEMARKMVAMRETPSKEYKNQLKAEIIRQLAEQEKGKASGDFDTISAGVHRRKMWQAATAALIVMVVWAIILVLTIVFRGSCSVPASSPTTTPGTGDSSFIGIHIN